MNTFSRIFNFADWQQILAENINPWHFAVSILDILIVAYLIYRLIRFVQGTRLMILVRGVLLFIIIDIFAGLIGFSTLKWLLNQISTYGVIALIIIFQPEIRQALERLGHTANLLSSGAKKRKSRADDQIAAYEKSFEYMSKRKIGALIAIERSQTLNEYVTTGIRLDADITSELFINIFIPNTPLHDGAVIVQGDKIAATCAYLPLTDRTDISKEFGTRHRAAIGLSEVSDALILVVSEETGGISIAYRGVFYAELSPERFHEMLSEHLLSALPNSSVSLWLKVTNWLRKDGSKEEEK